MQKLEANLQHGRRENPTVVIVRRKERKGRIHPRHPKAPVRDSAAACPNPSTAALDRPPAVSVGMLDGGNNTVTLGSLRVWQTTVSVISCTLHTRSCSRQGQRLKLKSHRLRRHQFPREAIDADLAIAEGRQSSDWTCDNRFRSVTSV
jgi:hypothetical protein